MQVFHRSGGPNLAVSVRRKASAAPPVLLVHGMGGDHTSWRPVLAGFADRTTVAVDLRGHGRSAHADRYGLTDFRDDLEFVLDAGDVEQVDVIAHSLGGHTALRLAMTHPDRVRRLVVEEPPPMPLDAADLAEQITPSADLSERIRGLRALIGNPRPYFQFDRALPDAVQAQFETADPHWWESLAAVQAPTLVVSGGERSFLPPRHLERVARTIPAGEFITIASGHSVHRDRPREFSAAARAHLAQ